jgi:hypothetical protein
MLIIFNMSDSPPQYGGIGGLGYTNHNQNDIQTTTAMSDEVDFKEKKLSRKKRWSFQYVVLGQMSNREDESFSPPTHKNQFQICTSKCEI